MQDMTEMEYNLLSELIGMEDRGLAKQIELAIWTSSHVPNAEILARFVSAFGDCEDGSDFPPAAKTILDEIAIQRATNELGYQR